MPIADSLPGITTNRHNPAAQRTSVGVDGVQVVDVGHELHVQPVEEGMTGYRISITRPG
ncbi:hypothetical protein [Frankia sp. ACN1ag]|uniref:hypothetical protein n=1 Tax=Frankia sp. ACN1ag TaxID=102891 RepID=UPI000A4E3191|nr:hypothetical protein [Frankia sp. ACN1ag]